MLTYEQAAVSCADALQTGALELLRGGWLKRLQLNTCRTYIKSLGVKPFRTAATATWPSAAAAAMLLLLQETGVPPTSDVHTVIQ